MRATSRVPPACRPPPAQLAASAGIPLRGLLAQRRLSGSWRLKEATAGVAGADRLDLGRATVQLAWFPLQPPAAAQGGDGGSSSSAGSDDEGTGAGG